MTKLSLTLRYHWKTVLLTAALVVLGAFSALAQEEEPLSPCVTRMYPIGMTSNAGHMNMTVTNLCDGVRLHVEIEAVSDSLDFSCEQLTLRQPRDLSQPFDPPIWLTDEHDDEYHHIYYYGGHGYHHREPDHFNHYVTVHHSGNTAGICHPAPILKGQPRRFWISVEPERVDNPQPLSFLKPFSLYYGGVQIMLTYP